MKLFGHTFGHKTNPNRVPFEGISPTADEEATQASEAAFKRLEQEKRVGRVTMYGTVHSREEADGTADITAEPENLQNDATHTMNA